MAGLKFQTLVLTWFILAAGISSVQAAVDCRREDFGESSFVCVCDSASCDEPDPVSVLPPGDILHVTSDRFSDRFRTETLTLDSRPPDDGRIQLVVDRDVRFQEVFGWGGAFTDAAGAVIATLSEGAQDQLVRTYFDPDVGLDYNTGRINIGGCDFSERPYTYCDTEGDVELETFALQEEDLVYKIPLVKRANEFRPEELLLFGSPWTAPPWMKSNNDYRGEGYLLPEYYEPWANYFVKFFEEYEKEGVTFWGLTAQNEPEDGNVPDFPFNCMGWNASTQSIFVADFLGPALENAGYGDLQLMIFDDQRPLLPNWVEEVLANPANQEYVDGFAIHWYTDDVFGLPNAMDITHEEFPDKFMLYTEACTGDIPGEQDVILGDWSRGERYLDNIIEDLNHWVTGWTDWNLALNMIGGPNWAENYVDSPIIVNEQEDVFYKQPMFYAMGHISRFFNPGSTVISLTTEEEVPDLHFVAAERPDGGVAITIMNRSEDDTRFISIVDDSEGHLDIDVFPSSMHTFVYWP